MAEAKLDVNIGVDGGWKLIKVGHQLKKLARLANAQNFKESARSLGAYTDKMAKSLTDQTRIHRKHFDGIDKMVKASGGMIHKGIAMSAKFATIQVAALGAALLAVHAAFVVGQAAMKAWNWLMKAGAGAIGALATAASIAAAAMREHQAAMYAYKGTNMGEFGKGLNQVRVQMRMMQTDSQLATIGAEGLNAALAEIYKTSTYDAGSQKMLKSLMDFGAAGQDVAKGAVAAGKLIATIQNPKANIAAMKKAADELGPAMTKAWSDLNITTKEGLVNAINDGSLALAGGVTGQFDAVSGTLMSRFKALKTQAVAMFADFGQPLLAPTKVFLEEVAHSLKRTFVRISGSLAVFSQGSFFEGLFSVIEKLENFFVKFVNKYLPQTDGFFSKISDWMMEFKMGWNYVLDKLRPLIDGARVLETMFKNIFRIVGRELADGFGHINDLLQENRADVEAFGSKIGNLIITIFKYGKTLRDIFFDILPFINKVIDGLTSILDTVFSLMGGIRELFGGGELSSLALLLGSRAIGTSMKKTIGGTLSRQDINANVVNINSASINGVPMHGVTAGGQTSGPAVRNAGRFGATGNSGAGAGAAVAGMASTAAVVDAAGGTGLADIASRSQGIVSDTIKAREESKKLLDSFEADDSSDSSRAKRTPRTPARALTQDDRDKRLKGIAYAKSIRAANFPETRLKEIQNWMDGIGSPNQGPSTHKEWAMQDKEFDLGADGAIQFDDNGNPKMNWKPGGRLKNLFRPKYSEQKLADMPGDTWSGSGPVGKLMTGARSIGQKFRGGRTSAAYQKMFGDGKNFKGALNGGKASFGIGAALAAGSQFAPKEMQGALALGGAVAQFDPMMGLGVGLVGAGMNAKNPLAAVGMGAAGGAAMGMKIGGPYGAAVGAVLGGAISGIGSWWNKNKKRKQEAKKIGEDVVKQARDSMLEGMGKTLKNVGTVGLTSENIKKTIENASRPAIELQDRAKEALAYIDKNGKDAMKAELQRQFDTGKGPWAQFLPDQAAVDKAAGDLQVFFDTIITQGGNEAKVMEYVQDSYTNKLGKLTKAFGKSELEMIALAQETDTNLFNVRESFAETFKSIAAGLASTKEDINAAFADKMGEGMDKLRTFREQQQAPAIIDEIGRAIYEENKAGTLTDISASKHVEDLLSAYTQFYGGDNQQAMLSLMEQLGPGGMAFEQENGYFSDPAIKELFTNGEFGAVLASMSADTLKTTGQLGQEQVITALANLDSGAYKALGPTFEALPQMFTDLAQTDYAKFDALKTFLDPSKDSSLREGKGLNELSPTQIAQVLRDSFGEQFTSFSFEKLDDSKVDLETEISNMGLKFKDVVGILDSFVTSMGGIMDGIPDTTSTDKDGDGKPPDTTTPRGDTTSSRFNATFMKHQALSSMVTGKRQITSGVRNFNLGSINSDHVTGGALDLVGQNLGQYKSAVEANGGFAEFHGVNAARHLHVVPNARATGDSSTAVSMGAVKQDGAAVASSTNNYSININGYNKNPQQLAAEVLALIKANERSITERK